MGLFSRKKKSDFDLLKTKKYYERNRELSKRNYMTCPDWLKPGSDDENDELALLYEPVTQRRFFQEGKVAVGALVQANSLLFDKGDESCPANYIYSTDPFYFDYPGNLLAIARALFDTKGEQGYHPAIQKLADLLDDEYERVYAYNIPAELTEGHTVYFTTIMVDREHLPYKKITEPVSPMLVLENEKPDAVLLPYWYWKA